MDAIASPYSITSYHDPPIDVKRYSYRSLSRAANTRSQESGRSPDNITSKRLTVQPSSNDSSDDEDLAPIKLSAEAQAILGEDNSKGEADQQNIPSHYSASYGQEGIMEKSNRRSWVNNKASPEADNGSPAPRFMRTAGARPSPPRTLARDGSFMYKIHDKSVAKETLLDAKTPAPVMRRIRVSGSRNPTRSPPSSSKNGVVEEDIHHSMKKQEQKEFGKNEEIEDDQGLVHPSTIVRSRRSEEPGIHSTMRVRRIGTGTLLSGPVRRGMIRRHSDEENEQLDDGQAKRDESPEIERGRRATEPELEDLLDEPLIAFSSPKHAGGLDVQRDESVPERRPQSLHQSTHPNKEPSPVREHILSMSTNKSKPTPLSNGSHISSKSTGSNRKPIFKIPSLPPLGSANDQENEPPPTFKRSKPSAPLLEIHNDKRSASPELKTVYSIKPPTTVTPASPPREPLAARSNNTPHRPAPAPPPKMSLIDAATSAGANSRSKKSVHYVLNGRTYRRLDCIGRGGSSRVFRIMAENYKIFALKRVNLDEADSAAIAGYKGEIDLLKKLENVDRVIRLFDYEVNEEKGVLSVMMELGESDFNKMLNEQLKGENAKLDITFTRHYWKEMLECVKAVHDHGIVHSDLKPANFLLVKGQLKLIDFGIAGAIQDNTVNVHRENQIGTPNYMSPESLVCHTPAIGQKTGMKLLKLGRPSDVWSLGCILYQMTYGQPPFAHITKQFERIMSIPNPKVEIDFPGIGIGGAVVPFGLIKTLRRCLQRDQTLRPTIDELLSDSDPFLHPVAISPDMLGRVIGNIIGHCRKREEKLKEEGVLQIQEGISVLPKDDEMRGWPGAFYEKLREAAKEGTAW